MLLETEKLDQQCLEQVANGEVIAILVKQYMPVDLSRKLADKIMTPGYAHYINAPSAERSRLSLSCFVGYRGNHLPLTFWS
jgi:hypothetical protein